METRGPNCKLHVARCTLHVARCMLHVACCTLPLAAPKMVVRGKCCKPGGVPGCRNHAPGRSRGNFRRGVFRYLNTKTTSQKTKQNIRDVSFTPVTLLGHIYSPGQLFNVDASWVVWRSTYLSLCLYKFAFS